MVRTRDMFKPYEVFILIPSTLILSFIMMSIGQYQTATLLLIVGNTYVYIRIKYRTEKMIYFAQRHVLGFIFMLYGLFMGIIDVAFHNSWDIKAFTWLLIVSLLMLHISYYTIYFAELAIGLISMYGGYWTLAWLVMRIWVGIPPFSNLNDMVWIFPNMYVPAWTLLSIMAICIITHIWYFYINTITWFTNTRHNV